MPRYLDVALLALACATLRWLSVVCRDQGARAGLSAFLAGAGCQVCTFCCCLAHFRKTYDGR